MEWGLMRFGASVMQCGRGGSGMDGADGADGADGEGRMVGWWEVRTGLVCIRRGIDEGGTGKLVVGSAFR